MSIATKSSQGVSLYSRFVNRPLGRLMALAAFRMGISANVVTTVSAVVTYAAIASLALVRPSPVSGFVTAGLLVLGFALDSADGQVARMAATSSLAGEWYDHMIDAAKMVAVHAAILIGWYRFDTASDVRLLLALGYQLVAVVTFSGITTVGLMKRTHPEATPVRTVSLVRAIGLLPADYGVLCCSFALWGFSDVFKLCYLVLFVLNAVILVAFLARWFHELTLVDASMASGRPDVSLENPTSDRS